VSSCKLGQVPTSTEQCTFCTPGSYSFHPTINECKPCPQGGNCTAGGATLVPQQQYWHSDAQSDHIITCPNNNACQGNTSALVMCQNITYHNQLQVRLCNAWHECMHSKETPQMLLPHLRHCDAVENLHAVWADAFIEEVCMCLFLHLLRMHPSKNEQNRSQWPRSNQTKPNQAKSNRIKLNQVESNQIKSNQIKSNQIKSNQIKSNQIKPNQFKSVSFKSTQLNSTQVKSG